MDYDEYEMRDAPVLTNGLFKEPCYAAYAAKNVAKELGFCYKYNSDLFMLVLLIKIISNITTLQITSY